MTISWDRQFGAMLAWGLILGGALYAPAALAMGSGHVNGPPASASPTFVLDAQVAPLRIESSAYGQGNANDQDGDCLDDDAEHRIAMQFRPFYVFDSRENARLPNEPLSLYRVKSTLDRRNGCMPPADGHVLIQVKYSMLFRDDGGYVGSTFCGDRHRGDSQSLIIEVMGDAAGLEFSLHAIHADHYHWYAAGGGSSAFFSEGQYPVIYISGGKHHPYFDGRINGRASVYSHWGCHEAMDGLGAQVLTVLESPGVPHGRLNVGEPDAHPVDQFVSDLSALGFLGETAWGQTPFCGGPGPCGNETSSMAQVWGN